MEGSGRRLPSSLPQEHLADDDAPQAIRPHHGWPRVSVIVTNHNYGHYLEACLQSLFAQTFPPAEIIVVDDGSADGSADILERHAGRIIAIRQPNRGQAAAINAGFARSGGEVILLLDGDDLYRPDAVEAVVGHWHDGIAAASFGLELIDEESRPIGIYPETIRPDDGDNRPRLLSKGTFTFPPTSGNAFSRGVLEAACPLPEEAWRISADAVLIRFAALHGPMLAIPRVLGAYRIHGANNYYAPDMPRADRVLRGLVQVATAQEHLAGAPRLPAADRAEEGLLRLALAGSALMFRARIADLTGEVAPLSAFARRMLRSLPGMRARWPDRLAAAIPLAALALGGARSARLRGWIRNRRGRPVALAGLLALLGHRRLERRLDGLARPRRIDRLPFDARLSFGEPGPQRNCLAMGWGGEDADRQPWTAGPVATLEFRVDPTPGGLHILLAVRGGKEIQAGTLAWSAGLSGAAMRAADLDDRGVLTLEVGPDVAADGTIGVSVGCAFAREGRPGLWRRLARARPHFTIDWMRIARAGGYPPRLVHLPAGERVAPAMLLAAAEGGWEGWATADAGVVRMTGPTARMGFSLYPVAEPLELLLLLADPPARGRLRLLDGGTEIYAGEAGVRQIRCRLRPRDAPPEAVELTVMFDADLQPAGLDEPPMPGIEEIALRQAGQAARSPWPWLNPGQRVFFSGGAGHGYLHSGWGAASERGVFNQGPEASLAFATTPGLTAARLRIEIEPPLAPIAGYARIVGVSAGGRLLHSGRLDKAAVIDVPLDDGAIEPDGSVLATLHAAMVGQTGGAEARAGAARIRFVALSLTGEAGPIRQLPLPAARPAYPVSALAAAINRAREGDADPQASRAALAQELWPMDGRALSGLIARPGMLALLERIGAAAEHAPLGQAEAAILAAMPAKAAGDEAGRLAVFLCGMLLMPSHRLPLDTDPQRLPPALLGDPQAVGRYLGRDAPHIEDEADRARLQGHAERLLASAERLLVTERRGSARHRLAASLIEESSPQKILFGDGNLAPYARLARRCIERSLIMEGARLWSAPPPPPSRRRLRVGVIVRDLEPAPETFLALGMFGGIDRSRWEPVLFVLAESAQALPATAVFEAVVPLAGQPIPEAVATIRAWRLDVLIAGAFFFRFKTFTSILAHRLAPLQVMTSAVSPMTSGLTSFDVVLTCRSTEPDDAAAHYTERVVFLPEPMQCFAFPWEGAGEEPSPGVPGHGPAIAPGVVVMISGAMLHKIGAGLLDAWVRILAQTTGTVLVLYPLAPNWRHADYARRRFEERAKTSLARYGIDPGRLIILDEQPARELGRLFAAADIYLDSFPYSGATTVVEALAHGVPAVTLAGRTQRGLQGSSWARAFGLDDLVAADVEEYVATAVLLARDGRRRQDAGERIRARLDPGPPPFADRARYGRLLGDALLELAREKGIPAALDGQVRYIFHHMPKAGGTTCRAVFRRWFKERSEDRKPWATSGFPAPIDLDSLEPDEIVCAHFESHIPALRLALRHPQVFTDPRFRLITLVRDPLEIALSTHAFEAANRHVDPTFSPVPLGEYLRTATGAFPAHFDCGPDDWRQALDRYWFIGTLERLEECLAFLAREIGKPLGEIPRLNESVRREPADPEDVEAFRRNNRLDYEIYAEISARLDRRLRSGLPDPARSSSSAQTEGTSRKGRQPG